MSGPPTSADSGDGLAPAPPTGSNTDPAASQGGYASQDGTSGSLTSGRGVSLASSATIGAVSGGQAAPNPLLTSVSTSTPSALAPGAFRPLPVDEALTSVDLVADLAEFSRIRDSILPRSIRTRLYLLKTPATAEVADDFWPRLEKHELASTSWLPLPHYNGKWPMDRQPIPTAADSGSRGVEASHARQRVRRQWARVGGGLLRCWGGCVFRGSSSIRRVDRSIGVGMSD